MLVISNREKLISNKISSDSSFRDMSTKIESKRTHEPPQATVSHHEPQRPTTSHSDLPRATTTQNINYHEPPRAKNLSRGITTSQKLIIPDRGSFSIDYVSKICVI